MKIKQSQYKNVFAIFLETEKYLSIVLPSEGGKVASFISKETGREYLLQNSSAEYLHLGLTGDFEKAECSGFDDMFPTIDSVIINEKKYPDHGEVCRVSFSYQEYADKLVLEYFSLNFGYFYKKIFTEGVNGELLITYEITNRLKIPLKVLWAAHCLVKIEQGGSIVVPFQENALIDFVYDSNQQLDQAFRTGLKKEYLKTVWSSKIEAKKWYFSNQCESGFVGYQYPQGDVFVLEFDKDKLPYLGLWVDYGLVNGNYYIGLEPCSVGYDTVENAARYHQVGEIKGEESFKFSIALYIRGKL